MSGCQTVQFLNCWGYSYGFRYPNPQKTGQFEIQYSKSPDFECLGSSNGWISDPYCIGFLYFYLFQTICPHRALKWGSKY